MSVMKFLTKAGKRFYVIGDDGLNEFEKYVLESGIGNIEMEPKTSFLINHKIFGFRNFNIFKKALSIDDRVKCFKIEGSLFGLITKVIAESDDEMFHGCNIFCVSDYEACIKKLIEDAIPKYLSKSTKFSALDPIIEHVEELVKLIVPEPKQEVKKVETRQNPACIQQNVTIAQPTNEIRLNLSDGFINSLFIKTCDHFINYATQSGLAKQDNGVLSVVCDENAIWIHLVDKFSQHPQSNDLMRYLSSSLDNTMYKYYLQNRNGTNCIYGTRKQKTQTVLKTMSNKPEHYDPSSKSLSVNGESEDESSLVDEEIIEDDEGQKLKNELEKINHLSFPTNAFAQKPSLDVIMYGPHTGTDVSEPNLIPKKHCDDSGPCYTIEELKELDISEMSSYIEYHSSLKPNPCHNETCLDNVLFVNDHLQLFKCFKDLTQFEIQILYMSHKSIIHASN